MSKTFCPLPWIHLATRPNGDVRVCCTANASGAGITDEKEAGLVKEDGVAMNLRDHTIEEVFNSSHMRRTRLQMIKGEVPVITSLSKPAYILLLSALRMPIGGRPEGRKCGILSEPAFSALTRERLFCPAVGVEAPV